MKKFEKVEKTGIISTKFSLWCTPSVILGYFGIGTKAKLFYDFYDSVEPHLCHLFYVLSYEYVRRYLRDSSWNDLMAIVIHLLLVQ